MKRRWSVLLILSVFLGLFINLTLVFAGVESANKTCDSCTYSNGNVSITNISPSSGPISTIVTLEGAGFVSNDNLIFFDDKQLVGNYGMFWSSEDGKKIIFTVTGPSCQSPLGCAYMPLQPGNYSVYVQNINGISNKLTFAVNSQDDASMNNRLRCGDYICEGNESQYGTNNFCPQDCLDRGMIRREADNKF